jgi:predicted dehydrogenase
MSNDVSFPYKLNVVAVCDVYSDRAERAGTLVNEKTGVTPSVYTNENDFLNDSQLQAIIIATSWQTHLPIAIKAMKKGIRPGIECGGSSSLEQCFELVSVYEQTGIPCMFLENCNYGREEMALLNMTEKGVFGELIHIQCGYQHDLRGIADSWERRHYRLDHHIHRNGEFYPMHGLGPMMKLLKINNGNRFTSLVSVSSKARGIKDWAKEHLPPDHHIHNKAINQGDIITTILKTSNGETVLLTHDTTLPRPYSRGGRVQGTKGIWMEDNKSIYIDGISPVHTWENFYDFIEKYGYEHPMWAEDKISGIKSGHGGMDYLVIQEFVKSVATMSEPPIDTYEAALLTSITPLSEKSIILGSQPVEVPDFTHGLYMTK